MRVILLVFEENTKAIWFINDRIVCQLCVCNSGGMSTTGGGGVCPQRWGYVGNSGGMSTTTATTVGVCPQQWGYVRKRGDMLQASANNQLAGLSLIMTLIYCKYNIAMTSNIGACLYLTDILKVGRFLCDSGVCLQQWGVLFGSESYQNDRSNSCHSMYSIN